MLTFDFRTRSMHIDFEDKTHEPNTPIVSLSGFYLEDTGVRPELDLP